MIEPNHAREELQSILSKSEYTAYYDDSDGLVARLFLDVINLFNELLGMLFPDIEFEASGNSFLVFGLVITGLVILIVAIFLLAKNWKRKRDMKRSKPLQELSQEILSFESHFKIAQELEDKGDFSGATRHLFLALLLYLQDIEWLVTRAWKTNWEYYDEIKRNDKESAARFYECALLFERATYGYHQITKEEFEPFKEQVTKWIHHETHLKTKEKAE
ncbi:DUF4129 domain-containing protein [Alkalihalobacillus trypoxylicola]|uniref:Protein-glutamine gamma-glutamyltransferase-like C-terminal domain-containing protein n=1 Tax=Alkalihalobacillus trypoxylicola TaxID=519424 RepID=A0A161PKQ7_9BACI|nr:DUF4129 domain-containing protein [Alkalihalobacillus trypoxylicola]KYG34095.1 hypothetical protein AZF04_14790 [Alkalihalobacillus trypoxylicola]